MRVRITAMPPNRGIDGLDLSTLHVGSVYTLANRLGAYLVAGGFAVGVQAGDDALDAVWQYPKA